MRNGRGPRRGWSARSLFASLVRILLLLCLFSLAFGCGVVVQGYLFLTQKLPNVEKLKNYEFAEPTQIFAENGEVIGEFYHQRRYVVPIKEMPQALQDAFVAWEDTDFWCRQPRGTNLPAIVWLAIGLLKTGYAPPCYAHGINLAASRNVVLTLRPSKKFSRKVKEAVLCCQIEKALTKQEILYLYLNHIYLGSSAYGVEAAARTYFGKHAKDLTIAECAMLAGASRGPSRFSPKREMPAVLERRNQVLRQMWEDGFITQAQYYEAREEVPVLVESTYPYKEEAKDFLEQARRYIEKKYGEDALYKGGLKVYTTVDLSLTEEGQDGIRVQNTYIKRIVDRRDKVLEEHLPPVSRNQPERSAEPAGQ